MNIFLTGATGFIGRHLVPRLLKEGHNLISYSSSQYNGPISSNRHSHIVGDISQGEGLDNVYWHEIDAIIHLAAFGTISVRKSDWYKCVSVNIIGIEYLIHAISQISSPPLLIYIRTFLEDYLGDFPNFRNNPYIVTKKAGTDIVKMWASGNKNAQVIFCTIFQAYGPGDDPRSVLPYTENCLRKGMPAKLGSGGGYRDWIYIDDLMDAFVRILNVSGNRIQYFDLGTGKLTSLKEIVETLSTLMGVSRDLLQFDPRRDRGDTELKAYAKRIPPDWKPMYSIKEGLANIGK